MIQFSVKEINNTYLSLLNGLIKDFNNNKLDAYQFNRYLKNINFLHNIDKNDNCVYNTDIGNFLDIRQYIIDNTNKDLIMKNVQFI